MFDVRVCVYIQRWSRGHVDLTCVFGQHKVDLFLSLEHQNGNLLTFWYLHALKLMLSVLTQPAVVEEPRQRGKLLRKTQTSYHWHTKDHLELPPGDPVSVRPFFQGKSCTWKPAESVEQINSCSYSLAVESHIFH